MKVSNRAGLCFRRSVSVLCLQAIPIANAIKSSHNSENVQIRHGFVKSLIGGGCHCIRSGDRMSFNIREKLHTVG